MQRDGLKSASTDTPASRIHHQQRSFWKRRKQHTFQEKFVCLFQENQQISRNFTAKQKRERKKKVENLDISKTRSPTYESQTSLSDPRTTKRQKTSEMDTPIRERFESEPAVSRPTKAPAKLPEESGGDERERRREPHPSLVRFKEGEKKKRRGAIYNKKFNPNNLFFFLF